MVQIDARTVELDPAEVLVKEIHDLLLDQGLDQVSAVALIQGSRVPDALRSLTPHLDEVLTPEFVTYLKR